MSSCRRSTTGWDRRSSHVIRVLVNTRPKEIGEEVTIDELIRDEELKPDEMNFITVSINGRLVRLSSERPKLQDGDDIRIYTLAAGG